MERAAKKTVPATTSALPLLSLGPLLLVPFPLLPFAMLPLDEPVVLP